MRFCLLALCVACVVSIPSACPALQTAVDVVNADFFWQQGYTGDGVEIGIIDLLLADSTHPAISGNFLGSQKFANGPSWTDYHATAVTGAAVSQDPVRRGVAYDASWWTAQTTNPGSITSSRTQTIAAETFAGGLGVLGGNPAEVLSLSIGLYGSDAALDQWSLGLDHIAATLGTTVVVAAGNDGPAAGTFSGPPSSAFNIISVGATGGSGAATTEDYTQIAPYSSRGPVSDGRIKPDLVAPGSLLELPTLSGGWVEGSGTSFATPLVSGGAALLIDMGRGRGWDTDSLVIKSVLMNSAEKLPGWSHTPSAPLDTNFGTGQMNLETAFGQYDAGEQAPGMVAVAGWDHGTIAGSTPNVYEIEQMLPADADLSATLVWNRDVSSSTADIETTVYAASALANLDLYLYDLSDPMVSTASSISTVDNVEHLFLSIPTAGTYALEVRSAAGMMVDPLTYSIAWTVLLPPVLLPGDFNGDDMVDAADYVEWRDFLGAPAGALLNDVDGGMIGQAQYDTWRAHYGMSGEAVSAGSFLAVPEPGGGLLIAMAASLCLLLRGRRLQSALSG